MTTPPLAIAEYEVLPEDPRFRVDRMAAERLGLASRSQARKLLKRGELLLNGEPVETSRFVQPGDRLQLLPSTLQEVLWEQPLEVVYEDPDLAVIFKPAGPPVSGNFFRTVEHALPFNLGPSAAGDALPFPRPVHRLDRRTRGLLLVARSASAQVSLGRQFQERQVRKRYRAILVGRLEDSGTIDTALEERAARTRWAAVRHDRSLHCQWLTTVDLWPETGRTHQLRRHMAQLGHPVLGDDLYTEGRVLQRSGLFLAAVELQLTHPRSGEPLHFVLPEPSKFVTFREREERRWSRSRDA